MMAAPDGTGHKFTATSTETTAWAPGAYWWALRATSGDEVVEIERGEITIEPDLLAAPDGYDGRSEDEKALAAINAVIAKRATLDQERYRINNRELYRTPIKDLIALRAHYARLVAAAKRKASGIRRWGRPVQVRFTP